jgi:hypothetical protein
MADLANQVTLDPVARGSVHEAADIPLTEYFPDVVSTRNDRRTARLLRIRIRGSGEVSIAFSIQG